MTSREKNKQACPHCARKAEKLARRFCELEAAILSIEEEAHALNVNLRVLWTLSLSEEAIPSLPKASADKYRSLTRQFLLQKEEILANGFSWDEIEELSTKYQTRNHEEILESMTADYSW